MIRASVDGKNGGKVVVLGVTKWNVDAMREGRPIAVELAEFGLNVSASKVTFSVIYGDTHEAVVDELERAGVALPDGSRDEARAMDERLRAEDAAREARA